MLYDLHTHTSDSDGKYTPEELITQADIAGIDVLAITDHDTVSALDKAYQASLDKSITLIPGVELSVTWSNKNFHVIGLNIDPDNKALRDGLEEHKQQRELRAVAIGQQLEKCGIKNAYAGAKLLASDEAITRNHFARFLVEQGYAKNIKDVFKKYLARNKPGYVKTCWISMEEGIHHITQSGGIAVLAHPLRYSLTGSWMRKLLVAFKNAGGQSLEVVTASSTVSDIQTAAGYASRFELTGSIGSDFHGHENNYVQLGQLKDLPDNVIPVWHDWN